VEYPQQHRARAAALKEHDAERARALRLAQLLLLRPDMPAY